MASFVEIKNNWVRVGNDKWCNVGAIDAVEVFKETKLDRTVCKWKDTYYVYVFIGDRWWYVFDSPRKEDCVTIATYIRKVRNNFREHRDEQLYALLAALNDKMTVFAELLDTVLRMKSETKSS